MIIAQIDGLDHTKIGVQYSAPVDATSLNAADYTSPVDGSTGVVIFNVTSDVLELEMDNDVTATRLLQYAGTDPQVLSPDSIAMTF